MAGETPWTVTQADEAAANTLFDELDAAGWPKVGAYKLFKDTLAQHRHESQVELVEALREARDTFQWLHENEPDALGWHPPYPSDDPEALRLVAKIDTLLSKIGDAS